MAGMTGPPVSGRGRLTLNELIRSKATEMSEWTVEIQELDENGRPRPTGQFETLAADTVILALGQESDTRFLASLPGIAFDGDVVQVDPATLMTGAPGVFAGGDAVPSERTLTVGVGHGKKAARNIDAWLRGTTYERGPKNPEATIDKLHLW